MRKLTLSALFLLMLAGCGAPPPLKSPCVCNYEPINQKEPSA